MAKIIYILTDEAMPDLIKVGFTSKNIEERIRTLDNTSVPLPFQCFYAAEVTDAQFVEKQLHKIFEEKRTRPSREFFRVDPNKIVVAV